MKEAKTHGREPGGALAKIVCMVSIRPRIATLMKSLLIAAAMFLTFEPSALDAATIVLTNIDAINTTSFNTGLNWANGVAPTAGNAYQTAVFRLRTPANTTPITFAGDSLEEIG